MAAKRRSSDRQDGGASSSFSAEESLPAAPNGRYYGCFWSSICLEGNRQLFEALEYLEEDRMMQETASPTKRHHVTMSALAYRRAAMVIRCFHQVIRDVETLSKLPLVSRAIRMALAYALQHGTIRGYSRILFAVEGDAIRDMTRIWGAGYATAWSWYHQGFRSAAHVVAAVTAGKLACSEQVQVSCEYWDDLIHPLSREDTAAMAEYMLKLFRIRIASDLQLETVGGYRRGKAISHDIDLLITHPDAVLCLTSLLPTIINVLKQQQLLIYVGPTVKRATTSKAKLLKRLSGSHKDDLFDDLLKELCIIRSPYTGRACRVDVIIATRDQWAYALVGWTGNKMFNRELRRWAEQRGYYLSSSCMWQWSQRSDGQEDPIPVACSSERDVFKLLELPYWQPEERNH